MTFMPRILSLVMILATLFLAGCGKEVVPPDAAGTLSTLAHVGKIIAGMATGVIVAGLACGTLCAIALLASAIPAVYGFLSAIPLVGGRIRTFLLDAIIISGIAVLVGTSDLWVSSHTWVLTLAIVAGLGYLLLRFHSDIFTPRVIATVEADTHAVMADIGWAWNKFTGLWHHSSGTTVSPSYGSAPVVQSAPTSPTITLNTSGTLPKA